MKKMIKSLGWLALIVVAVRLVLTIIDVVKNDDDYESINGEIIGI